MRLQPNTGKTKQFLLLATGVALAVGALLLQATMPSLPEASAASTKEAKAPPIRLETLDGKKYDLAKDPNKVVVIDFWATWCPPCVKGLPKLQETADWVKKENLKVSIYPINVKESPSDVLAFWQEKKLTMPVLLDTQGTTSDAYSVQGIPTTVVIVDGKITKTWVGLSKNLESELRTAIQSGLKATEAKTDQKPKEEAPKTAK